MIACNRLAAGVTSQAFEWILDSRVEGSHRQWGRLGEALHDIFHHLLSVDAWDLAAG